MESQDVLFTDTDHVEECLGLRGVNAKPGSFLDKCCFLKGKEGIATLTFYLIQKSPTNQICHLGHTNVWLIGTNTLCLEILNNLSWDLTQHFLCKSRRIISELEERNKLYNVPTLVSTRSLGIEWSIIGI